MLNNTPETPNPGYMEMLKKYLMEKGLEAQQMAQQGMMRGNEYIQQNVIPPVIKGIQTGKEMANEGYDAASNYAGQMKTDWDKIWKPWPKEEDIRAGLTPEEYKQYMPFLQGIERTKWRTLVDTLKLDPALAQEQQKGTK
jgi:hypothetical protein